MNCSLERPLVDSVEPPGHEPFIEQAEEQEPALEAATIRPPRNAMLTAQKRMP